MLVEMQQIKLKSMQVGWPLEKIYANETILMIFSINLCTVIMKMNVIRIVHYLVVQELD